MFAIPYRLHHSSLLQALLDDTDVAFKTLWALLIMKECRTDLLFVAKQTLADVSALKLNSGIHAREADCELQCTSEKRRAGLWNFALLVTKAIKTVVEELELEARGMQSEFEWEKVRDWKYAYRHEMVYGNEESKFGQYAVPINDGRSREDKRWSEWQIARPRRRRRL